MPCRSTLSAIWVKYLCGKTDIVPTCSAFEPVERFAEIVLREREEIIDVWNRMKVVDVELGIKRWLSTIRRISRDTQWVLERANDERPQLDLVALQCSYRSKHEV
jgi:hypothetical protein